MRYASAPRSVAWISPAFMPAREHLDEHSESERGDRLSPELPAECVATLEQTDALKLD